MGPTPWDADPADPVDPVLPQRPLPPAIDSQRHPAHRSKSVRRCAGTPPPFREPSASGGAATGRTVRGQEPARGLRDGRARRPSAAASSPALLVTAVANLVPFAGLQDQLVPGQRCDPKVALYQDPIAGDDQAELSAHDLVVLTKRPSAF